MRPLCRKCKATRSRCAECRAAAAKEKSKGEVPGSSGAGSGVLMFIVLGLVGIMLVVNWKGCPAMPKNITWLKSPKER